MKKILFILILTIISSTVKSQDLIQKLNLNTFLEDKEVISTIADFEIKTENANIPHSRELRYFQKRYVFDDIGIEKTVKYTITPLSQSKEELLYNLNNGINKYANLETTALITAITSTVIGSGTIALGMYGLKGLAITTDDFKGFAITGGIIAGCGGLAAFIMHCCALHQLRINSRSNIFINSSGVVFEVSIDK